MTILKVGGAVAAGIGLPLLLAIPVRSQNPSLLFGQSGSAPQVIKVTSNALWVSLQAVANVLTITRNALATTSTDGVVVQNTTTATGAVPVQISPRLKLCGTADNTSSGDVSETDCFIVEVLPATVAGPTTATLNISASIAGGAYTNRLALTSGGNLTAGGSVLAGNNVRATSTADFQFGTTNPQLKSSADKLLTIVDSAAATGTEINNGTPTLGTCTGGSLTSGSHNGMGEVTGNTSGSCIINFGSPNFTNSPFCFVNDETALIAVRISARSNSSITVTGAGNGDAFQYFCIGRIGT